MKIDNITKLYDQLTNKERAALAFRYVGEGNETESHRIFSSVPRFTYLCPDFEYLTWLDAFFCVWHVWAIDHWQCRYRAIALSSLGYIQLLQKQEGIALETFAIYEKCESRLLALDAPLEWVCTEHGIDLDKVRSLTETEAYRPSTQDLRPDKAYLERTQDNFRKLIAARAWSR